MRILVAADVSPDPDSGAAGTEYQTVLALRERGHQVDTVWAPELGRRIRHGNLHYAFELPQTYRRALRAALGRGPIDVCHFNQSAAFLAARAHRRSGCPGIFVARSHGFEPRADAVLGQWRRRLGLPEPAGLRAVAGRFLKRLLDRQHRLVCREADGLIVSCEEDRRYLTDRLGVPSNRVACIPQAPPPAYRAAPPAPYTRERWKRLLHVGAHGFWKAPHLVVEVAGQVLRAHPEVRLTWVCNAEAREAVGALLPADLRARVDVLAWRSQADLMALYDTHGVFLFPSLFEGFGKAFLEALCRGLVVVASATGGMRDVIRPGQDGYLAPVGDGAALARHVLRAWEDFEAASALSARARETADRYSWERVAEETETFYKALAKVRHR